MNLLMSGHMDWRQKAWFMCPTGQSEHAAVPAFPSLLASLTCVICLTGLAEPLPEVTLPRAPSATAPAPVPQAIICAGPEDVQAVEPPRRDRRPRGEAAPERLVAAPGAAIPP